MILHSPEERRPALLESIRQVETRRDYLRDYLHKKQPRPMLVDMAKGEIRILERRLADLQQQLAECDISELQRSAHGR